MLKPRDPFLAWHEIIRVNISKPRWSPCRIRPVRRIRCYTQNPQLWTLLCLHKSQQTVHVTYVDTLEKQADTAVEAAVQALSFVRADLRVPARQNRTFQSDGLVSCGLLCLQWCERQSRDFMKVGQLPYVSSGRELAVRLMEWIAKLLQQRHLMEAKAAERDKPVNPDMPPLPPPDTPPPPCVPDEPAKTEGILFGCSKCSMLKSGCLACNPAKTVKHLVKTQPELFQSED